MHIVTIPQPIMIREIVGFGPNFFSKKLDGTDLVSVRPLTSCPPSMHIGQAYRMT